MGKTSYSKAMKIKVSQEACKPEYKNCAHIIADKYGIRTSTVLRWKEAYELMGEAAFSKRSAYALQKLQPSKDNKRIKALEEELEFVKKAAAFMAKLNRE